MKLNQQVLENSNLRQKLIESIVIGLDFKFYLNVDFYDLATCPYLHNHADSMLSIIMLDTF